MADLNSLGNITNASTALSNLILVTPQKNVGYQPQNPSNPNGSPSNSALPPGFLFDYEGENTVTLDADITDSFVEDNTAIQDQVALRPALVTVQGFVGELNDIVPKALQILKTIADKLTAIGAYTPALSTTALIAYNEAKFAYDNAQNVANAAVAAWSSVNGNGAAPQNQNKQQIAYQQFYGYYQRRTLFTIQTPWQIFTNMAIKTMRVVQDPDNRMITEFEMTFKQMNFAQTLISAQTISSVTTDFGDNRGAAQNASTVQVGPNAPPDASSSFGSMLA